MENLLNESQMRTGFISESMLSAYLGLYDIEDYVPSNWKVC